MPVNSARNQLSCCFHQALLVAAVSPHQLLLGFSVSTILWWARIVLRPSSLRSGPDHEFEQWRLKASERKLRTIALRAMSGVEGITTLIRFIQLRYLTSLEYPYETVVNQTSPAFPPKFGTLF